MNTLQDRVAIVTGAGRGIGREHALLFASQGAKVVVNDLGGSPSGEGSDQSPAQDVVAEIDAAGGTAVANHDDVSDWQGAKRLVDTAIEAFGDLDVLVNNAGILRDRMIVNMEEQEWDAVLQVHLKGHFAPLRWAADHWRRQTRSGRRTTGSVINTASPSGLFGNIGQANYGAAKMGIAALTIIASKELERYGVRVNAIAPVARTRLTAPQDSGSTAETDQFDDSHPGNISPFVGYLATADCPINGRVFILQGGTVRLMQPWAVIDSVETDDRWTVEGLQAAAGRLGDTPFELNDPWGL